MLNLQTAPLNSGIKVNRLPLFPITRRISLFCGDRRRGRPSASSPPCSNRTVRESSARRSPFGAGPRGWRASLSRFSATSTSALFFRSSAAGRDRHGQHPAAGTDRADRRLRLVSCFGDPQRSLTRHPARSFFVHCRRPMVCGSDGESRLFTDPDPVNAALPRRDSGSGQSIHSLNATEPALALRRGRRSRRRRRPRRGSHNFPPANPRSCWPTNPTTPTLPLDTRLTFNSPDTLMGARCAPPFLRPLYFCRTGREAHLGFVQNWCSHARHPPWPGHGRCTSPLELPARNHIADDAPLRRADVGPR